MSERRIRYYTSGNIPFAGVEQNLCRSSSMLAKEWYSKTLMIGGRSVSSNVWDLISFLKYSFVFRLYNDGRYLDLACEDSVTAEIPFRCWQVSGADIVISGCFPPSLDVTVVSCGSVDMDVDVVSCGSEDISSVDVRTCGVVSISSVPVRVCGFTGNVNVTGIVYG